LTRRAVIFDMDGVLVDSEPLHTEAFRELLAEEGVDYSEERITQEGLGRAFASQMGEMIDRFSLPSPLEHYAAQFEEKVLQLLRDQARPSPGAAQALDELARRGCKLALASSSARAIVHGTLEFLGFERSFQVVVSGDLVTHSKPHPEIFLLAASRLGVRVRECIVVEDSPRGVEAGKRAGMVVVAVRTPLVAEAELASADHIIPSLWQFPYHLLDAGGEGIFAPP